MIVYPRITAFLCGAIATLAMPPFLFLAAGFALGVPIFLLAREKRLRQVFMLGWMTGLGWFAASLYWIGNALITGGPQFYWMLPFVIFALPTVLGIYWGVAFLAASITARPGLGRVFAVIFWLAVSEWLRGMLFTGFPWQTPGMAFAQDGLGFALASVIGVNGCTVIALIIAAIPAVILINYRFVLIPLVVISGALTLGGVYSQKSPTLPSSEAPVMRLVQGGIPQNQKWDYSARADNLNKFARLSQTAPQGTPTPDLIVWGETDFAGFLDREIDEVRKMLLKATVAESWLITGGLRHHSAEKKPFFNSAYLLTPDLIIADYYDKRHLVPWGEYTPFREFLPFVDHFARSGDMAAGATSSIFTLPRDQGPALRILPLICYEIIFPAATRKAVVRNQIDVIINLTNDAWYGDTIGPRQHLAMAQMRAAELGVVIIRVASTGISAAIDPHGAIISSIPYDQEGVIDAAIPPRISTLYAYIGDWAFILLLLLLAAMTLAFRSRLLTSKPV